MLGLAATAFVVAAVAVIVWLGSAPRDPPPLEFDRSLRVEETQEL